MKRLIITYPICYQMTEDEWVRSNKTIVFDEDATVADIVEQVEKERIDTAASIVTIIEL